MCAQGAVVQALPALSAAIPYRCEVCKKCKLFELFEHKRGIPDNMSMSWRIGE